MNYYIITGASKGLGEALAESLIGNDNHVFCISRSVNQKLIDLATSYGAKLDYIQFDLSNVDQIEGMMLGLLKFIDINNIKSIVLINNAGTIAPISPVGVVDSTDLIKNVHINQIAPMLLCSIFISFLNQINVNKQIINISSGAGKKAYFGWANYCSSKAGIDMFTRCTGVEQRETENPVKIVSFAPGIIDTEMQEEIRSSDKSYFPELDRFIAYKNEGKLLSAQKVAEYVIQLMHMDLENGAILDIKQIQ